MKLTYLLLSLSWLVSVLSFTPEVSINQFKERTSLIIYFDDSSNILSIRDNKVYLSKDDGKSWSIIDVLKNVDVIDIMTHPYNKNRAFAVTDSKSQFHTDNNGESWSSFTLEQDITYFSDIQFNSAKEDYILLDYYNCPAENTMCDHYFYYSNDNLKTPLKLLKDKAETCLFAKSSKSFTAGSDEQILCAISNFDSFGYIIDSRLVSSTDWFQTETPINDAANLLSTGTIYNIKVIESFIVVMLQVDKYNSRSKLSLFISKDGLTFHQAKLDINMQDGSFQFLPSTPNSLYITQINYGFMPNKAAASNVFGSDSTGIKFKKIVDYYQGGFFSFSVEKIQNIDGVWLSNSAIDKTKRTSVKSSITLDDGLSWNYLKVNNDDSCKGDSSCSFHLLTAEERDGSGKFVTGPTPGILMGVGSKGTSLTEDFSKLDTYVSRDGGISWDFALDEPCAFSFGDQGNIIVAVPYYGSLNLTVSNIKYSLDQGKTWESYKLEKPVFPMTLTTTIDGTSTKFLFSGLFDDTPNDQTDYEYSEIFYSLDFSKAFDKTCGKDDFEDWIARSDMSSQDAVCIDGHKEKFSRRKQDSQCFVNKLYDDVKTIDENCACTDKDFECSDGFVNDDDRNCVLSQDSILEMCEGQKHLSIPDRRKVQSNTCSFSSKKESDFSKIVKIDCDEYRNIDARPIQTKFTLFSGDIAQFNYLEKSETYQGECLVIRTNQNEGFSSSDGGVSFEKLDIRDDVLAFYLGSTPDMVYAVTASSNLYISENGGRSFESVKAPTSPNRLGARVISFNKKDPKQFIWYGDEYCDNPFSSRCRLVAFYTTDGGYTFAKLKDGIRICDYASSFLDDDYNNEEPNLMFCQVINPDGLFSLVSSKDYFGSSEVVFEDIVGYAITGRFFVIATVIKENNSLKAKVSVDGKTFADAEFPPDFHVDKQQAYTILDSSSKAIFIHVTTNALENYEFGTILKSNSNGTSYVLSVENVNRNRVGYVDFEKIEGLEGVAIINIVDNPEEAKKGAFKKIKTQITHNDGGEWSFIPPPAVDSEYKKYQCNGKSLKDCSLNLHGYTERKDYRDTFSSGSAVGVMMGLGNVGTNLSPMSDASTFLTTDGGITWNEVKKGVYMWEFGDLGTVIVLVKANEKTKTVVYSLDEGNTWNDYEFTDDEVTVIDIATVPSDTSRKFMLFATSEKADGTLAFSIDFSLVHSRQCKLDLDNPSNDDYEFWTPKHPFSADNCLFGHEAKYLRRVADHTDCFIGSTPLSEGFRILRNCSCSRRDYECDYNYFKDSDGTCKLVKGLSPIDHSEVCQKPNVFGYFEPTGYRKIPVSTCESGQEFDKWVEHACPGHEDEFKKEHNRNMTGLKFLLVFGIPFLVFIFATWFVYDKGIRRNGGFARFGQIRLDDDDFHPVENNDVDRVVNTIVSGGILVVASLIAVFKTLRAVDKAMIGKVKSLFTGRNRRGNYVSVRDITNDEDELFGEYEDNIADEEAEEIDPFVDDYDVDSDAHAIADDNVFGLDESDNSDANTVEFDAEAEANN